MFDVLHVLSICDRVARELGRPLDVGARYIPLTDTILLLHDGRRHEIAWSILPSSRIGWHPDLEPHIRRYIERAPFRTPAKDGDYP